MHQWNGRLLGYDGIGLDGDTRTVPIRILVDDPKSVTGPSGVANLVRGMYVTVKLLIKPQTPLVVIPAEALKPGNRVWSFLPDASVLDELLAESKAANLSDAAEDESAGSEVKEGSRVIQLAGDTADGDAFDPDQWVPGRVIVRDSVIAVDSLVVVDQPVGSEQGIEPVTKKLWVCESRGGELEDGSFVVVSPLGGVDKGGLPSRTRRSMVGSGAGEVETD